MLMMSMRWLTACLGCSVNHLDTCNPVLNAWVGWSHADLNCRFETRPVKRKNEDVFFGDYQTMSRIIQVLMFDEYRLVTDRLPKAHRHFRPNGR